MWQVMWQNKKEKKLKTKHIIIVTGLSGAGKTTALNILEDMNYYTIDNLPLGLEKISIGYRNRKIGSWY